MEKEIAKKNQNYFLIPMLMLNLWFERMYAEEDR